MQIKVAEGLARSWSETWSQNVFGRPLNYIKKKKKKERKKENGPLARQAPLSTEFSRQEYWSEFPCPSPRDLPNRE